MQLKQNFNSILPVLGVSVVKNESTLFVQHTDLIPTLLVLKNHITWQYTLLSSISGVDYLYSKQRFCVVYDLLSLCTNSRVRLKTFINEITSLESATTVFKNANWWEREVWDLFGIYFKNHLDLRRLLTDYGFEGFPMRKDYPLVGFIELRYDLTKKRIVLEPVELAQDFRFFNFETPW